MASVAEEFPVYALDAIPIVTSFPSIGEAIDHHNYEMASNYATDIIDEIKKNLLFIVLEHRAYAFHKMNKYQDAIGDAQEMISIAPTSTKSYLLLGKLYSALGKQKKAIDIYKIALSQNNVTKYDTSNNNDTIWTQQLVQEMNKAVEQNEKRMDPISKLPKELLSTIFTCLNQESKVTCWNVSKKWRYHLSRASSAWSTLSIDDKDRHTIRRLTAYLPDIATHVRHLILDTLCPDVSLEYLESMNNGDFNNIKSLKVTGNSSHGMRLAMFESFITTVLPRIGHSLTELELDLFYINNDALRAMKLGDILASAPHLTRLVYLTTESLSTVIGDLSTSANVENHHPLIDLELNTIHATRKEMEPLLKKCSQLRCLKLFIYEENITDLLESYCPHLQILFYNYNLGVEPIIPNEEYIQFKKAICAVKTTDLTRGLKVLDINWSPMNRVEYEKKFNVSHYIPPLILNNQMTLKMVNITNCPKMPNLCNHPTLHMPNLKSLRIKATEKNNNLQQLFLQSIPFFPNLHTLQVTDKQNFIPLVETLMTLQRPLKKLTLTLTEWDNNGENDQGNSLLIRLFQQYVTLQSSSSLHTTVLESINIQDWSDNLSDEVLNALSDIKTIRSISIYTRSPKISIEALTNLFKRLASEKVTFLEIGGLPNASDNDIIRFVDILKKHLTYIHLYDLDHLTAYGTIMSVIPQTQK
ncbi:hypothetical protein INT45_000757 [Circinella minor]|uniref:F-box domain-containing protein n=1 Tax=Circinella minor TaxID=1195481 RepID=A0A8H7S092_9FUNG|nr:hypothetical protein INT45_000757 [Circinella minor]